MRTHFRSFALPIALLLATSLCAPPRAASQGMIVHDPANVAQNLLQAARALQQVNNQIKQLENELRMLKSLDLQLAPEVAQSIQAARELFGQAQKIRYNIDTIADDMRDLYPDDYKDFELAELMKKSDVWIGESRDTVRHLLEQQARAANDLEKAQGQTEKALIASAAAEGQTSAIQASNQMLGVLSQQLAQMQALQIAQSRSLAEERLERAARDARAIEISRKAFPSIRDGAKPAPARSAF